MLADGWEYASAHRVLCDLAARGIVPVWLTTVREGQLSLVGLQASDGEDLAAVVTHPDQSVRRTAAVACAVEAQHAVTHSEA